MSALLALTVFLAGYTGLYLETAFLLLCSPRTQLPFCCWETVLVMDAGSGHTAPQSESIFCIFAFHWEREISCFHTNPKKNKKSLNHIFGATHATAKPQALGAFSSTLHVCLPPECKSQPRLQQAEWAGFPSSARTHSSHQLLSGFTKT